MDRTRLSTMAMCSSHCGCPARSTPRPGKYSDRQPPNPAGVPLGTADGPRQTGAPFFVSGSLQTRRAMVCGEEVANGHDATVWRRWDADRWPVGGTVRRIGGLRCPATSHRAGAAGGWPHPRASGIRTGRALRSLERSTAVCHAVCGAVPPAPPDRDRIGDRARTRFRCWRDRRGGLTRAGRTHHDRSAPLTMSYKGGAAAARTANTSQSRLRTDDSDAGILGGRTTSAWCRHDVRAG